MSGRHNIRKGIAALLSVLSVGSVAGATGKKGPNRSRSAEISNKGKGPGGNVGNKKLISGQNVNPGKRNLNSGNPLAKSMDNLSMSNKMGYREHFKAGANDLYDSFRELPAWEQTLILGGAIETINVLATHKGALENVFNLFFNRFISLARGKIFGVATEEEVSALYAEQDLTEDIMLSKLGPITSVLAKFSYYLKDSWVDPLVAFVRGLQGVKFEELAKFRDRVGSTGGDLEKMNFAEFKGFIDNGEWGPARIKGWWSTVSSGFKVNTLNMFFYNLGWAIHGKNVVQGPIVSPQETQEAQC